ncbi:MAG: cupredoxin domain-containing protein [Gemmatimonadales bacterium]
MPTAPSPGTTGTGGSTATVTVGNNFYNPAQLTVAVGTTVTWQWAAGDTTHSVTFDDGPTSNIQNSGTFQRAFGTAGTFTYFCKVHGRAVMSGTVTVGSGGTGGTGGSGMGGGGGGGYPRP